MTYRCMMVTLDATLSNAVRADAAIALAREFGSHLIGLAPIPADEVQIVEASAPEDLSRSSAALAAQARELAQHFRNRCEAARLPSFESLADKAPALDSVALHAQCTDLLVLSQPDPSLPDHGERVADLERAILHCARPVLVLPYTHAGSVHTSRALLAWDGSRESVRAMTDALPFMRRAETVRLMHWRTEPDGNQALEQLNNLRQWLAFQGVDAEAHDEMTTIPIGEALLNEASDMSANLIVMGAYGHSRWTERLLGGVSKTLLQSMTVPVLMSH